MRRTLFVAVAAGSLLAVGLLVSRVTSAADHSPGAHEGHGQQARGDAQKGHGDAKAVENGFDKKPAVGTKAKCPVMGKAFTVTKDTTYSVYKGKYYAFCCPGCKPQFDKDPEKYLK